MSKGIGAAALLVSLSAAAAAQAAIVEFQVDPTRSVLTLGAAGVAGETGYAQEGGSSASYSGTIQADINGNRLEFITGDYAVVASNSAGNLQPGNSPANYAIFTVDSGFRAALRNFRFDFKKWTGDPYIIAADGTLIDPDFGNEPTSPNLLGAATITDSFGVEEKDTEFNNFARPPGTEPVKLTQSNGVFTLEIPVRTAITWSRFGAGDGQFELVGTIVATTVPEPTTLTSLALGGALLLTRRRRA
jgi:hypothetical protein